MSHPGPHAWTSAQATEPSSQTPGFATATQAGPDTTAPLVNIGERDWRGRREGSVLHVTTQPWSVVWPFSRAPNCELLGLWIFFLLHCPLVFEAFPFSDHRIQKAYSHLVQPEQ